jgi:hypothetical protein
LRITRKNYAKSLQCWIPPLAKTDHQAYPGRNGANMTFADLLPTQV